ncbi:MAG: FtsX-like permease family protein, partial [Gemmatimonadetes bacterium]|nr:FtsX-like permease family protein [Gemmatimonadota bacterium]NIR80339.1 FtsX-like permease family protein [Gemmatimonadota bacterium]NIT89102.1 FtsX-like permease family protein [Gemmatimonadota bacterium]NIU32899.1 FtsX-like permease family protein [Gemmatimonadota bacterium]NIU37298.1 FtsX-like permease family protein [Gemmatimonadota bacterium]
DRRGAEPVTVVNETLARRLWGMESAVGRALPVLGPDGSVTDHRVVGVAREIQYGSLAEGPRPFAYLPAEQRYSERMTLLAAGDPGEVVPPVRRVVGELAPGLPIVEATTVEAFVDEDRLLARAAATVGGVLGGLALILAALGIYGTVAFSVQRRRPELGVRLAMGAAPGRIFRQVIGRGLLLSGAAGLAGLAAGLGAAALIDDLLVGTSAADPVALLGAPALLGLIVTLALLGPARQAAALDPVEALREE